MRRLSTLPRTDWFRVLADLQSIGWDNAAVAKRLEIPRTTLRMWKIAGSEPCYYDGNRLLRLWMDTTGKQLIPVLDPLPAKGGITSR